MCICRSLKHPKSSLKPQGVPLKSFGNRLASVLQYVLQLAFISFGLKVHHCPLSPPEGQGFHWLFDFAVSKSTMKIETLLQTKYSKTNRNIPVGPKKLKSYWVLWRWIKTEHQNWQGSVLIVPTWSKNITPSAWTKKKRHRSENP